MIVESDEIKDLTELLQNLQKVGPPSVKREPKPDRKRAKTARDATPSEEVKNKLTIDSPKISENEAKISTKEPTKLGKIELSKREPRSKAAVSLGPAQNTRSRLKSKDDHSSDSKTRNLVMVKQ